ncbi:FHIPEP family type III secretion protein, partial [Acinetobacter baumannii]
LFPGMPKIPFIVLAAVAGYLSWYLARRQVAQKAEAEAEKAAAAAAQTAAPQEEPITTALRIDELRLELGFGLLPLINDTRGFRLTDQI